MNRFLAVAILMSFISMAFGVTNEPLDIKEALRKAEEGDLKSQNAVGYSYYEGVKLPKDPGRAIYWLQKSADAGFPPAQVNLGFLYSIGFGVPEDLVEALRWYEKAAQQGNTIALFNVGSVYANGIGVPVDLAKAAGYLQKAAEKNNFGAKLALGGMYMNGEGVPKDVARSIALFKNAARGGEIQAQLDLGKIYANGIGVAKDIQEARYWYNMAAEKFGSKEAKDELRQMDEAKAEQRAGAAIELSRPNCSTVRFNGIAVGGTQQNLAIVRSSRNLEDLLARNPLHCSPSAWTQTYLCQGAALMVGHVGYIIS